MYKSEQERLQQLEATVEKQGFQIYLLQHLAMDNKHYAIYFDILSSNMTKQTFEALRALTLRYEDELLETGYVSMSTFLYEFSRLLMSDAPMLAANLAPFMPRWLGGVDGGFGFSKALYEDFYVV